jgi:ribonuclease P protein component
VIGRIVQPADFARVLDAPQRSRSAHFALHHLDSAPSRRKTTPPAPVVPGLSSELSTDAAVLATSTVDDCRLWLGLVVPKRHAKRAVTRSLVKRQMRAAVDARSSHLPGGLWVLRLKAPFERSQYPSAASDALRHATRAELSELIDRAITAPAGLARPRGQRPAKSE